MEQMEIKAFKAYRFNPDVVGDAGRCIAPPYDVISSEQQGRLYRQSPYNIVRIIRGRTEAGDDETKNQYTRAADYLNEWVKKGVLKQDGKEAIYAYVQDFEIAGKRYSRSGFIALGKLAEFGSGVRPHEETLDGPKADRLKLMQATSAQFGQIFMLYDDVHKTADKIIEKTVAGEEPVIDFTDEDRVRHRMFVIDDAEDISATAQMIKDKEILIADGHHRYETALNYRRQTDNPAAQWRMMTFINMQNSGLVILPTHRLVGGVEDFDFKKLLAELVKDFECTKFAFSARLNKSGAKEKMFAKMRSEFDAGRTCFGLYVADGAFYTIVLKSGTVMDKIVPQLSEASRKLNATVLHKLILERFMGIGEQQLAGETNIEYIKDIGSAVDEAIAAVDKAQKQIIFFMNPTRSEQVRQAAAANEKMPQKSTFFFPKIFSGLTINKL
jgi:uncharacterized protein (DUF1015 family)